MKKIILAKILENLRTKPHLRKKVKIFVLFLSVSFIFISGLLIWAGIGMYNKARDFAQTTLPKVSSFQPKVIEEAQILKSQIEKNKFIDIQSCWKQAESLIAIQPWIIHTIEQNVFNLIQSCWNNKETSENSVPNPKNI